MIDIEKHIGLLKDVSDKQIVLKNRLNNLIKKCYESNLRKTLIDVYNINNIDIGADGNIYFDCTVEPKYGIRLPYLCTLIVDKTLLTMSDEKFNNLVIHDFNKSKYNPITFEGLI